MGPNKLIQNTIHLLGCPCPWNPSLEAVDKVTKVLSSFKELWMIWGSKINCQGNYEDIS